MANRPISVAPDSEDDHPGLLTVWNPELKPDTIKAHVDILRDGDHVWWARIYKGKSAHPNTAVDDYAPYRKLANQDALLVFVTDFRSLHALRVGDIRTCPHLDPDEEPFTPEYSRGEKALAWFKVTDIRAISHDPLEALDWMKRRIFPTHVGGEKTLAGTWGYDPYASLSYFYPIVVKGPAAQHVFEPREIPEGYRRFAEHDSVFAAPLVERAFHALAASLGAGTWTALADDTKFFLASTHIVHGQLGSEFLDVGPRMTGLARAVERELRDEILLPLYHLRCDLPEPDKLENVFQGRKKGTQFRPRDAALGGIPIYLGKLHAWARARGAHHLSNLGQRPWIDWLDRFADVRNSIVHAHHIDRKALRQTYDVFHDDLLGDPSRFHDIVRAKAEVAVLRS